MWNEYVPAAHITQDRCVAAAVVVEYVPAGHGWHVLALDEDHVPASHDMHAVLAVAPVDDKYVPALHATHVNDVAADAQVPAAHAVHVAAPMSEYEPALHATHRPPLGYWPHEHPSAPCVMTRQ